MTEKPSTTDPDSNEPHEFKQYISVEHLDDINEQIKKRERKLPGMKAGLTKLARSVGPALKWLEGAMEKYAEHAERTAKIRNNYERRKLDRGLEDRTFLVGRENIKPARTTFKNRPEWDDFTLAQRLNIYRHSSGRRLKPLELSEHRDAAEALDRSAAKLREYLTEAGQWVRCKISGIVDEAGKPILDERTNEPILSPSSLEFRNLLVAINDLFKALKAGAGAEKELLEELRGLEEAAALHRTAVKKRQPRLHVDWANYFKDVKEKPFSERVKSKRKRYKRDRLGRFAK